MSNMKWESVVGAVKAKVRVRDLPFVDFGVDLLARFVCWVVAYRYISRDTQVPDVPPGMSPARWIYLEWYGNAVSFYQRQDRLDYIFSRIDAAKELRSNGNGHGDPPAVHSAASLSEAGQSPARRRAARVT